MLRYVRLGPYLTFSVLGKPIPQGAIRHFGKGRPSVHANQDTLLPFRDRIQTAAEKAIAARGGGEPAFPLDSAVGLSTYFTVAKPTSAPKTRRTYPITRPDTSHLIRAVEDALTAAGVYKDDARIIWTEGMKVYPGEEEHALHVPGVLIEVYGVGTVEDAAVDPYAVVDAEIVSGEVV